MARARKQHIQEAFEFRTHGGKRKGAGRPPKGKRSSEPHKEREAIDPRHPLHVVTRVVEGLGSLRKRDLYRAVCEATVTSFKHGSAKAAARAVAAASSANVPAGSSTTVEEDATTLPRGFSRAAALAAALSVSPDAAYRVASFRIVHASIQRNHLHLLVEASNKDALSEGMQVLLSAVARRINRALLRRTGDRRRGQVFADRYFALPLTTPRQVRNCLAYVLNNWRRHGEDREHRWNVDPFSTGIWFPGWKERADAPLFYQPPPNYVWMMTWLPKTWLLREGWKKHPLISLREVPGPLDRPRRSPRS